MISHTSSSSTSSKNPRPQDDERSDRDGQVHVGIEVLDLTHHARAAGGSASRSAHTVCTTAEADWVRGDPERLAVCIVVKGALIKVLGGRYPSFEWTDDLELMRAEIVPPNPPPWMAPLAAALQRTSPNAAPSASRCLVRGSDWPRPPGPETWAAWISVGDRLVAVAATTTA